MIHLKRIIYLKAVSEISFISAYICRPLEFQFKDKVTVSLLMINKMLI